MAETVPDGQMVFADSRIPVLRVGLYSRGKADKDFHQLDLLKEEE